jgi:putative MFS transporter
MSVILERLDSLPLKRLHGAAALLCAVAFGIDLMGVSISTALSAVFSAPPHVLTTRSLSWLLASVYIGAVIGASLVGRIADRYGLQRTLAGILLLLGVASIFAAFRADPLWFGAFRLLSGVALGAYPPLMVAYLTETSPAAYRGLIIFWVCGLAYLAPPLGVFLIRWATPLSPLGIDGWRWPFVLAGVAALTVGVAMVYLPESVRWLLRMGRTDAAEHVCAAFERSRSLTVPRWMGSRAAASRAVPQIASQRRLGVFAFVLTLYALQPWALIAFPLLTGPMLLNRGHSLSETLLYVASATLGPVGATFFSGMFVDRVERRVALVLGCVLMLVATGVFFYGDQPALLAGSVIAFSIGVAITMPVMTLYGAELFPTSTRASATALAWAGNRLAAGLVPLVMFPLFRARGSVAVCVEVASALVFTIGLVLFLGPKGAAGKVVQ